MFDHKNLKHKYQHQENAGSSLLNVVYPVVLIFFTFLTVYLFLLGKNGFYVHKEKLAKTQSLQFENRKLYEQIVNLQKKNHKLMYFNDFVLEGEARKISLKKPGDIIIHIPDQQWIDNMAGLYDTLGGGSPSREELLLFEEKVFLGVLVILLLAGVSMFFSSVESRNV